MKTTLLIDEQKLKRVMKLTGIKTRRQAVDFALDQAERVARVMGVLEGDFFVEAGGQIIDPGYDVMKVRKLDRPRKGPHTTRGRTN